MLAYGQKFTEMVFYRSFMPRSARRLFLRLMGPERVHLQSERLGISTHDGGGEEPRHVKTFSDLGC